MVILLFKAIFYDSWFQLSLEVFSKTNFFLTIAVPFIWKCRISAIWFLSVDTEFFQYSCTEVTFSFTVLLDFSSLHLVLLMHIVIWI